MLPLPAEGHLISFLRLAKQLQHRFGFTITIVSTPLNVYILRSTIFNSDENAQIHLELPSNSTDHGLPLNTENTDSLTFSQIVNLFQASTYLEAPFHEVILEIIVKDV